MAWQTSSMGNDGEPGNFEVIRDTLLGMDPETRFQVVETMKLLRTMPRPAAVRVLAEASTRARELHMPLLRN